MIDEQLRKIVDAAGRKLSQNREELIQSFLAKYRCEPAEAILCVTQGGNSFIRKMSEKEIAFRDLVREQAQKPDVKSDIDQLFSGLERLASAQGFEAIGVFPSDQWGRELIARLELSGKLLEIAARLKSAL